MALFDGSTSYMVTGSPPLSASGYPITFGAWICPTAFASGSIAAIFQFTDTGATPPWRMDVRMGNTGLLTIFARDNTTAASGTTSGTLTTGKFAFVVGRFISATNRRLSVLFPNGSVEHVQNTTNIVLSGLDALGIGAVINAGLSPSDFFPGILSEIWYADADVQADGAQLQDALLRQLAYMGPFSLPHFRKDIVEYHALRATVAPGVTGREYYSRGAATAWTPTAVKTGIHPPLPAGYEAPRREAGSSFVMI